MEMNELYLEIPTQLRYIRLGEQKKLRMSFMSFMDTVSWYIIFPENSQTLNGQTRR